jgi:hypothetical protein
VAQGVAAFRYQRGARESLGLPGRIRQPLVANHAPTASLTISGCFAAILSRVRAAPLGWMVPRSHLRTVPRETPNLIKGTSPLRYAPSASTNPSSAPGTTT